MRVELLASTQLNPVLVPQELTQVGDIATLWNGQGTDQENLIEYAGRLCYRSTERMGTAPGFITARVREGHEDIIEHVVITVHVIGSDDPLRWRMVNRHCEVGEADDGSWIVSGNTRVWLYFFRHGVGLAALPVVRRIVPAVFAEFPDRGQETGDLQVRRGQEHSPLANSWAQQAAPLPATRHSPLATLLLPREDAPMRVTLLGFTWPALADPELLLHHGAATFLFEGISRACTHQLVRHRLASFSQESQRYVSMEKGQWNPIVPPAIAAVPQARSALDRLWASMEESYAELRALGIRKEDARFLLPNATETRIVATMNFAAWSHFLWLRAVDMAAQWEIRRLGQRVLEMLHAVAPKIFQEHWKVYRRDFAGQP